MLKYHLPVNYPKKLLALGPESAGNFCVYNNGQVFYFNKLGDLLEEQNFENYKKTLFEFLDKNQFEPDVICVDLHPDYKTTQLGQQLAQKYNAELKPVQHHIAHIYSVLFDQTILSSILRLRSGQAPKSSFSKFIGIACDGTGYGFDQKIWGGEVFLFENNQPKRIGSLEEQMILGGDLAIKHPARMLLSILLKISAKGGSLPGRQAGAPGGKKPKQIWPLVEKYFSKQEFAILLKMHEQKFNSVQTTSTGRILDAASILLGFCENERKYKHEPVDLLEKNSTVPFELELKWERRNVKCERRDGKGERRYELSTSYLFEWLLDNLNKDKNRLAATVQKYLISGLILIAKRYDPNLPIYFGGGMANNKIMSEIARNNGLIMAENIEKGDYGLSLGQTLFKIK